MHGSISVGLNSSNGGSSSIACSMTHMVSCLVGRGLAATDEAGTYGMLLLLAHPGGDGTVAGAILLGMGLMLCLGEVGLQGGGYGSGSCGGDGCEIALLVEEVCRGGSSCFIGLVGLVAGRRSCSGSDDVGAWQCAWSSSAAMQPSPAVNMWPQPRHADSQHCVSCNQSEEC
jgi:hypothetical protein